MRFITTTLFGGLFVVLPVLLLYLAVAEIFGLLVDLATPLTKALPTGLVEKLHAPVILAVLSLVAVSFIFGLAMRSSWIRQIGTAFERSVLEKIPMYKMLKSITTAFGDAGSRALRPALFASPGGGADPAYIIEDHGNGKVTVLLPWSPTAFAGTVKILDRSTLQPLDCSFDEFSRSLSQLGFGMAQLVQRQTAAAAKREPPSTLSR
jgi:uncharacterized membrane protein